MIAGVTPYFAVWMCLWIVLIVFTCGVSLVSINCANGKTGEWSFKASGRLTSFENLCNDRSDSLWEIGLASLLGDRDLATCTDSERDIGVVLASCGSGAIVGDHWPESASIKGIMLPCREDLLQCCFRHFLNCQDFAFHAGPISHAH